MNIDASLSAVSVSPASALALTVSDSPIRTFSLLLAGAAPPVDAPSAAAPQASAKSATPPTAAPGVPSPAVVAQHAPTTSPLPMLVQPSVQGLAVTMPSPSLESQAAPDAAIADAPAIALAKSVPHRLPDTIAVVAAVPSRPAEPRAAAVDADPEDAPPASSVDGSALPPDQVPPPLVIPLMAALLPRPRSIAPAGDDKPSLPLAVDGVDRPWPTRVHGAATVLQSRGNARTTALSVARQIDPGAAITASRPGDISAPVTHAIDPAKAATAALVETIGDGAPGAAVTPVVAIDTPAPAVPAKPAQTDAPIFVVPPSAASGPTGFDRRVRPLLRETADTPQPLAVSAELGLRLLPGRDAGALSTPSREIGASAPVATDATAEVAVTTDRFGDVRIAVEGTATDIKVTMALAPTATLGASDAQRLATGLAADLAASGVRLQSLDISGGDTGRGGSPQGQREPPASRPTVAPVAPPRSATAPRSDRYA